MYEDGQAGNATAIAQEHTDPKLAVDPKKPAVPLLDAWLYLTGDEKLFGKLEGIGPETLRLTTPWQDHLDVPLARVVGFTSGLLDRKESAESFAKRLKTRGSEDLLLAQTKNGEVIAIPGIVEGIDNDKLRFRYQDRTRTMPLKQVEGLIMAARPESPRLGRAATRRSRLPDGVVGLRPMERPRHQRLEDRVGLGTGPEPAGGRHPGRAVRRRQDDVSLRPHAQQGRGNAVLRSSAPWRRDVNLLGEPLRMKGQTYPRGVAVHSRSALDVRPQRAILDVRGPGRVRRRAKRPGPRRLPGLRRRQGDFIPTPISRPTGSPVPLKLPVTGAEQLRLVVDFGRGQDTGDRVIWANARLYRPSPKTAASRESGQ